MKRIGNIYDKIISFDNLLLAHKKAKRGKSKQKGVIEFEKNVIGNILVIQDMLRLCLYVSPKYQTFTIFEPKERKIFVLPYPHRVIQHAILQVIGDMFVKNFTKDTYSCIKGRGVHKCKDAVHAALKDRTNSQCTLKMDITKFYPSVDLNILKKLLLAKIKDEKVINLLFEILDGNKLGLPIGSYLSQYLGNFYLSSLDHYIKEQLKPYFYARYCDDLLILSSNKQELHRIRLAVEVFLRDKLNLQLKGNYQVFPTSTRGIDFLGYVFYHDYTKIRKSIKKRCINMFKYKPTPESKASYYG